MIDPQKQSLVLEAVARARLIYDMTLSAARHSKRLDMLRTSIDDSGYDVIADWQLNRRYLQLKCKVESSSTSSWNIWPSLLKPRFDSFGAKSIPSWQFYHPFGLGGAVVLTEIKFEEQRDVVRHYYTDIFILHLLANGVIGNPGQKDSSADLLRRLAATGHKRGDRVSLTKKNFVVPENVRSLNELVGLETNSNDIWRQLFYRCFAQPSIIQDKCGAGPDKEQSARLLSENFQSKIVSDTEAYWLP